MVTLKVMKRYYVAKYKKEWLQELIGQIYYYMEGPFKEHDRSEQCVRIFYDLCDKHGITKTDLINFGW